MQALSILFGAAFTVATAWALGRRILARCDLPAEAFVTGASALSAIVFVLAALHLAYPVVFLAVGAAAIAFGGREVTRPRPAFTWLAIPFAVYFVLYFFNAMAPEVSPDGAAYHLGLVSRYFAVHGLERITTSLYANLSQGMEMLFLFAFAFGRHSAAAMVHFAFLLALVWSMWSYGKCAGFPVPAACAALLVFASPVVGIDGISAYNDVAVAAIAFTLFRLLHVWEDDRDPRLLAAIGLVAGFAFAVKYTAALAVPYALGFVLWKDRRWRSAAVVAAASAVMIAPWLVKNWLWMHNPLSPFFNRWFPNPYIMVGFEREYSQHLAMYDLKSRWEIPMQVTIHGSMSGLLGPVFLLAPLALIALTRREGRRLLAAALVFGATYFTNIGTRFLIPPLPFVAMAMMLAAARVPALPVAIALLHAVISWPALVPRYSRPEAWRLQNIPWKEALRLRPPERYLEARLTYYGVSHMIEQVTEPGATIFTFVPVPEAYTSRRILVTYQSAENSISGTILWTGLVREYAPTWRLRFDFPRRPLRALRLVQNGAGTRDQWNIHEFRIYDGARELPRAPRWRLTADPYPWGIQNAFDNSLLTFWVCGDWIGPGQTVTVDFGGAETADSAVVETAPDQWGVKLALAGRTVSGAWETLAPAPSFSDAAPPLGLRRAAAQELKRRGIDYILVFDADLGAAEIASTAASWGIELAGSYGPAKLYRIRP